MSDNASEKDAKPREFWLHERSQMFSDEPLNNPNCIHVIEYAELLKWKSRCASLTAEVILLRKAMASRRVGPLSRYYWRKYWNEANRIKAEREKSIEKPVTLEVSSPAEG